MCYNYTIALLGGPDGPPTIHASTQAGAQAINVLRGGLQQLDASAHMLTIQRMQNEEIYNTAYGDSPVSVSVDMLDKYKRHMESTMKRSSNSKSGFIVWLKLNGNLPLNTIKAEAIIPKRWPAICDKLRAVGRRLLDKSDNRLLKDYYTSQCNFHECRLSKDEEIYALALQVDPMQWNRKLKEENDWQVTPFNKIPEANQNVSSAELLRYINDSLSIEI